MSPHLEWTLIGWSLLATCWWAIAICVVWRQRYGPLLRSGEAESQSTVSVFKPIPAIHDTIASPQLVAALESYIDQSNGSIEILLGIEKAEAIKWEPVIKQWRQKFPGADLKPIVMPRPAQFLSPRVSWLHTLAGHARGELWMWSDADMIAPPGSLDAVRGELLASKAGMVTCPYVVRRIERVPMMLEALFVNVELYPGVLFCGRIGPVRFGLGAGMMFSAARFRKRARWEVLGARMADDNALGKLLAPVKVSATTFETLPAESNWRDAFQHYRRWQKTVRWCQPAGYAAEIIILPVLGWFAAVVTHPATVAAWLGLAGTALLEMLAGATLFRLVGCELRAWWVIGFWSVLLRPATWLASWLPWPVAFRSENRKWRSLYRSEPLHNYL